MKNQLYKKLAAQIYSDYASALTLPSERSLGERYVTTRTTIRAALQELQEQGKLRSTARKGHTLIVDPNNQTAPVKNSFNVIVFCSSVRMNDQSFLDFLGGILHSASLSNINVTIREIEESRLISGDSFELFHCGIEADGYILTFLSEGLRNYLEHSLKPCIALGNNAVFKDSEKRRFFRIFLPQFEKFQFLRNKLIQQNHKNILCVSWTQELTAADKTVLHLQNIKQPLDSTAPAIDAADAVCKALKNGNYTALQLTFGGATSLEIYRRLINSGVEIPKRLSLTVDSARYDYWIRVYRISSAYSSPRDEGILCMTTLTSQLQSGFLEFGDRFTNFTYVEGDTIAPAMTPEEIAEYDRTNPWLDKL